MLQLFKWLHCVLQGGGGGGGGYGDDSSFLPLPVSDDVIL